MLRQTLKILELNPFTSSTSRIEVQERLLDVTDANKQRRDADPGHLHIQLCVALLEGKRIPLMVLPLQFSGNHHNKPELGQAACRKQLLHPI